MAIRDEIRHQQRKLKGKGVKAHISYFLTYYTWSTIAVVCGIAVAVALVTTILTNKTQALCVIMLNASTSSSDGENKVAAMEDGYAEYAGINPDRYLINLDTTAYQTPGLIADSYDIAASQKISVEAAAGTLDSIVADASNFYYYAYASAFLDLREVLSEDMMEQYADVLYYVDQTAVDARMERMDTSDTAEDLMTEEEGKANELVGTFVRPDPAEMENPVPVGIIVTDAPQIRESGVYTDRVAVYGIVQRCEHRENAISFLSYLWEE